MGGRKREYSDPFHRLSSLLANRTYHKKRGNHKRVIQLDLQIRQLRKDIDERFSGFVFGEKPKKRKKKR